MTGEGGSQSGGSQAGGSPAPEFPFNPRRSWYALAVMSALVAMSLVDRLILAVVAQPVSEDLGFNDSQLGLLMGAAFASFYALAGLPLAHLLDRGNRVRLMAIGALVWGAGSFMSGFSENFAMFAITRAFLAMGEAVVTPASVSLIADYFPSDRRSLPMSIYFASTAVALSLTFGLGGACLEVGAAVQPEIGLAPWRTALMLVSLPSIILGIMALCTIAEPARQERRTGEDFGSLRQAAAYFRQNARLFGGFFLGITAIAAAWMGTLSWLPTALVRGFGYAPADASYLLGLVSLPMTLVGSYLWPAWAARMERKGRIGARPWVMFLVTAATVAATPWMLGNAVLALAAFGLLALVVAGIAPIGTTIIQSATPQRLRARATGLYTFLVGGLAFTLGPFMVSEFAGAQAQGEGRSLLSAIVTTNVVLGVIGTFGMALAIRPIMQLFRSAKAVSPDVEVDGNAMYLVNRQAHRMAKENLKALR